MATKINGTGGKTMTDKITREIDAHKALKAEAEKAKVPARETVAADNPFTIDAR